MALTAIVKATFSLPGGGDLVPTTPEALALDDSHTDELPTRGVRTPSDWVPFRQLADVTLVGHAWALAGAVRSMHVRLAVFDGERALVDKTLAVRDDVPFRSMPVEYERAVGGLGRVDNPIGVGAVEGDARPTLVHLHEPDRPAAFAPIPSMWAARRSLRGAFSRRALLEPLVVLPPRFDHAYFQSAPPDQRCAYLTGSETLVLEGLHPEAAHVQARLPRARAHGVLFGPGLDERHLLSFVIDALHIDTDRRLCTLTWRCRLDGVREQDLGEYLFVAGVSVAGNSLALPATRQDAIVQPSVVSGFDRAPFVMASPGDRPSPLAPAGAPWSAESARVVHVPAARQNATLALGLAGSSVSGTLPMVNRAAPVASPYALAPAGGERAATGQPWPLAGAGEAPPPVRARQATTLPVHHAMEDAATSSPSPMPESVMPAVEPTAEARTPPFEARPLEGARPTTPWAAGPELGELSSSKRPQEPRRLPERLDARALLYRGTKREK